jgi:hypothetical protein
LEGYPLASTCGTPLFLTGKLIRFYAFIAKTGKSTAGRRVLGHGKRVFEITINIDYFDLKYFNWR